MPLADTVVAPGRDVPVSATCCGRCGAAALLPRVGLNWAIAIVTLLFSAVHFPQYWGAWAGLAGLTLLSLALTAVRASTRSIFPCVVIHTLNNLVAAIQILSMSGESQ